MLFVSLLYLLSLGPEEAIEQAARDLGRPDIAPELLRICKRESNCKPIGIHLRDARPGASSYAGQVHLKHLDPTCQPKGDWRRWGTRSLFGMNAADAWPYMPECYQPEWLDIPYVASLAAAKFYIAKCDGKRGRRWCPKRRRSTS